MCLVYFKSHTLKHYNLFYDIKFPLANDTVYFCMKNVSRMLNY